MNRRALIVALIISGLVSLMLWGRIKRSQQAAGKATVAVEVVTPKVSVVVSTQKLAARTRLDADLLKKSFKLKKLDENLVPKDAYTSIASITNRYTSVTILPDDIMTPLRLLKEEQVPSLALAIPKGKRAITITVSEATSVGGFIQQGDFVDIIATIRPRGKEATSKIILQDIQVLAVGTTYEFDSSIATTTANISANKAKLVTLAVSPQETEKLMYLETGVSFRLILKNPHDKDMVVGTTGVSEKEIFKDLNIYEDEDGDGAGFGPGVGYSYISHDEPVIIMQGAHSVRELRRFNSAKPRRAGAGSLSGYVEAPAGQMTGYTSTYGSSRPNVESLGSGEARVDPCE